MAPRDGGAGLELAGGALGDRLEKDFGVVGSNGAHLWQEGPEWEGAALAPPLGPMSELMGGILAVEVRVAY